jgi:hypothetical protein
MAIAIRGGCGSGREDFDLVFIVASGAFAMLSQYTANPSVETRLAAFGSYQGIASAMPGARTIIRPFRGWEPVSSAKAIS